MEKFLWNAGGVAIFVLSMLSLIFLIAKQNVDNTLFFAMCLVAYWIYMKRRPTWLEV